MQARTFFLIYFPIYGAILILLLVSYFRAVFTLPGYTDSLDVPSPYPEQQVLTGGVRSLSLKYAETKDEAVIAQKETIRFRV
jgi:hypothetical protein